MNNIDAEFFDEHSIFDAVVIAGYKDIDSELNLMKEMTRFRSNYTDLLETDIDDESAQKYVDTDDENNYVDDDDDNIIDTINNEREE